MNVFARAHAYKLYINACILGIALCRYGLTKPPVLPDFVSVQDGRGGVGWRRVADAVHAGSHGGVVRRLPALLAARNLPAGQPRLPRHLPPLQLPAPGRAGPSGAGARVWPLHPLLRHPQPVVAAQHPGLRHWGRAGAAGGLRRPDGAVRASRTDQGHGPPGRRPAAHCRYVRRRGTDRDRRRGSGQVYL